VLNTQFSCSGFESIQAETTQSPLAGFPNKSARTFTSAFEKIK
jgi:hypothetical protein